MDSESTSELQNGLTAQTNDSQLAQNVISALPTPRFLYIAGATLLTIA